MFPVTEADAVVPRVSSQVNDDTHEQEADEGDDFDATEPEFEFSENAYSEQVDEEN